MAKIFANIRGRALSTAKFIDCTALKATGNTVYGMKKYLKRKGVFDNKPKLNLKIEKRIYFCEFLTNNFVI